MWCVRWGTKWTVGTGPERGEHAPEFTRPSDVPVVWAPLALLFLEMPGMKIHRLFNRFNLKPSYRCHLTVSWNPMGFVRKTVIERVCASSDALDYLETKKGWCSSACSVNSRLRRRYSLMVELLTGYLLSGSVLKSVTWEAGLTRQPSSHSGHLL